MNTQCQIIPMQLSSYKKTQVPLQELIVFDTF